MAWALLMVFAYALLWGNDLISADNNVACNPFLGECRNFSEVMSRYESHDFGARETELKRILFWNEAYGSKDYGVGFGQDRLARLGCPVAGCYTTADRSLVPVDEFDAIVFHLRTYNERDLPSSRKPHQRYVFWSLESPEHNMRDIYPLNNQFNWTMTYKINSDVVQPYGWVEPLSVVERPRSRSPTAAIEKNKLVAWFASNCHTPAKREVYVKALSKWIPVDIYGQCGPFKCHDRNNSCYEMLERHYKFYLSFENSYCDDYATEKLFSVLQYDVVPVVFGGANYSQIAPPNSFIDATRFQTARQLAEYLLLLSNNDHLYRRYLSWKVDYRVRNRQADLQKSMCALCARLHVDSQPKIYQDLDKWWVSDSHCRRPRKDNVFRIPFWNQ